MYLTYDKYLEYGGTLDSATFEEFEFEASAIIDYYTFDRLKNDTIIPDKVQRLVYALIDIAKRQADAMTQGNTISSTDSDAVVTHITQQTNDGVSTSYATMPASDVFNTAEKLIKRKVRQYLAGVTNEAGKRLLYRGLYYGE